MTRAAGTLTSARRVAAVLLAVILTMTAQTTWAMDEGASVERGVYISKTFTNQDGSAVSSSDADTEFNFKMDEVDANTFQVKNDDGTYHKTASGKAGDEIAFPSFGIINTDFITKSNGEINGDQRIYRYYVIEEVPDNDGTIIYDSQKIYVKMEAHGYNDDKIDIKIWTSTDHQNWSNEVSETGNVGTFNNTKKQFMDVEVEKIWQKVTINGDQVDYYTDTTSSHTTDNIDVKLISVKTLLQQSQGEEPQTGEQPGQQGTDEPVPVTPTPSPARLKTIGSIQNGLKSVDEIIGNQEYTVVDTRTLSKSNNWKHKWENLPKHLYDTDGSIYTLTYYVVETAATGAASNSYSGNGTEKVTISNIEEETSATVCKVWSDNNNQDGIRPASLTVDLMNGSTKVGTVTLNETNNWTATVEHLLMYNNGQPITYTWSEKNLPEGYALTNTSTSESGLITTLTNSRTNGGEDVTWEVTDTNNDGIFETLTISGSGAMADYDNNVDQPWYPFVNNIKNVVIGAGVTSIGKNAFNSCSELTSVIIPANVTSIGSHAFNDCYNLVIVVVQRYTSGESPITALGESAFDGCDALTIYVPNNALSNNALNVYKTANYWKNYKNKIQTISEDQYCGDTKVNNGKNVYCVYHQNPGNNDITLVIAGTGVMRNGNDLPWYNYKDYIKSVNIGSGVTSISENAFDGCGSLSSVTIPASVTSIGEKTFNNCHSLESVTIPASVTTIGIMAFCWCEHLATVTFEGVSQLASIGQEAFLFCTDLTSINIPASVTTIYGNTFNGCGKLESIIVDGNNQNYASEGGVLFNKDKTTFVKYPEGKSGTSYVIPPSVTKIGNDAFSGCDELTSVTIPDGITSIGDGAFSGCGKLTSVTIPAGVTSIGGSAFNGSGWYNAQPDGLIYLDNWLLGYKGNKPTGTLQINEETRGIAGSAFYWCSGLTSITLPASVTSIGENTFYLCSSVTDVYCYANPTQLTWNENGKNDFISNGSTKCHVFKESAWDGFKSTVNVTFVGDLGSSTCPVELTEGDGVDLLTKLAGRTDITTGTKVNVTFSRTFDASTNGEGKASTVCLPYAVAKPDATTVGKFYTFGGVTENGGVYTVTMHEMADATTTAGTPYLFKPAGGSAVPFNGEIPIAASYATGVPPSTNGWEFRGTFKKLTWASGQTRLYGFAAADFESNGSQIGANEVGTFRRYDWGYCDAFRCYLWAPAPSSGSRGATRSGNALPESMRVILVAADGTTTDIGTMDTKTGDVTFDGEAWYSLDGRRLNGKPTKSGLYINNGKTIVIK